VDLFRALSVSASGMTAQRARMDAVTENLANSESAVTPTGRPYQRKIVILRVVEPGGFKDALRASSEPDGGVRVDQVVEGKDPPRRIHMPDHPHAAADGYVSMPNINPLREMLDMMSSTRVYEANATAFSATKSMSAKLLELIR
jgi:flagellar basal-body rod protein FlgC